MPSIDVVVAREILDSRGNPTVEVEVGLDDGSTDIDTLDALEYSLERNYKRFLKARNCTA